MTNDLTGAYMSDGAIERGSGKTWSEWRALLDASGAAEKAHDEIARYLVEAHGIDGWWAQSITVGYERLIGRRGVGQRADGTFSTSVSKTVAAGTGDHFAAWIDDTTRDRWLGPGTLTLRSFQENRSARFVDNEHGSVIALWFQDKGEGKSSVSVQVENLSSPDAIPERKAVWKTRLADLASHLGAAAS